MNNKIKHLEMIENVIERMANNSFKLKELAMVLVSAFVGISIYCTSKKVIFLTSIPILGIWLLDSFYLMKERQYRKLFNMVRIISEDSDIDFNMSCSSTDCSSIFKKAGSYLKAMFSLSEFLFYSIVVVIVPLVIFAIEIF